MNWTTEPPKSDGWYWWRQDELDPPECVEVARALGAKQSTAWMVGELDDRSITSLRGEWLGPISPAQLLNLNHVSALRSELDALSSNCTGEVKAPSYASIVKELHLTRMALNEAERTGFERGVLAAIEAAESVPTSVSVHATAHDASVATRCKEFIVMAIEAETRIYHIHNPVITIPKTDQPSTDAV